MKVEDIEAVTVSYLSCFEGSRYELSYASQTEVFCYQSIS